MITAFIEKLHSLDISLMRASGGRKLLLILNFALFGDIAIPMTFGGMRLFDLNVDAMRDSHDLMRLGGLLILALLLFQVAPSLIRLVWYFTIGLAWHSIAGAFPKLLAPKSRLEEDTERWAQLKPTHVRKADLLAFAIRKGNSTALQLHDRHQASLESRAVTNDLLTIFCLLLPLDVFFSGTGSIGYHIWHWGEDSHSQIAGLLKIALIGCWVVLGRRGLSLSTAMLDDMIDVGSSDVIN